MLSSNETMDVILIFSYKESNTRYNGEVIMESEGVRRIFGYK